MNDDSAKVVTAAVQIQSPAGGQDTIIVSTENEPVALKIRDALLSDSRLGGADLDIRVQGKHAIVSGSIRADEQRDLALKIAGRYVGRDRVVDQMQTGEQLSYDVCEA